MRSLAAGYLALLTSDALDLVVLVEIQRAGTAAPLRYAIDTEDRTWNGETWTSTSGAFGEVQESAEREIPSLQMVLQNADGVLGPLVHPGSGGEDLRGRRCIVRQADRRLLDGPDPSALVVEWTFFVNAYSFVGREAVAFELGVFPAEVRDVPDRTLQGLRCRWIYKGPHCGYAGTLPTCARTVDACRQRFGEEPIRFGGFPTSADARALQVV